jgi:hypothetical protein
LVQGGPRRAAARTAARSLRKPCIQVSFSFAAGTYRPASRTDAASSVDPDFAAMRAVKVDAGISGRAAKLAPRDSAVAPVLR